MSWYEVIWGQKSILTCQTLYPKMWQVTLKSCGQFLVLFSLDFVWSRLTSCNIIWPLASCDPRLTLTKPWIPDIPVSHIQSKWDLLEETEHNRELNLHEQLKRQERLNALASNFQKKELGCKPRKKSKKKIAILLQFFSWFRVKSKVGGLKSKWTVQTIESRRSYIKVDVLRK